MGAQVFTNEYDLGTRRNFRVFFSITEHQYGVCPVLQDAAQGAYIVRLSAALSLSRVR
jgi:hypothetical protein